jgi:hypothetical protein
LRKRIRAPFDRLRDRLRLRVLMADLLGLGRRGARLTRQVSKMRMPVETLQEHLLTPPAKPARSATHCPIYDPRMIT